MQLVKNVTSRIAQFSPVFASGLGFMAQNENCHKARKTVASPAGGAGDAGGGAAARLIAGPTASATHSVPQGQVHLNGRSRRSGK
jgi:hypothetical protein